MNTSLEHTQQFVAAKVFKEVAKAAEQLNLETYVVGGYVRDCLLKRGEPKDLDFVTVGSGIALAKQIAQNQSGNLKVNVFKHFGTAQVRLFGYDLEFVGARKESYSPDSRKPSVENGTLEDDQNRRDFTINALAISLNKADYGKLVDPFKGIDHLQKGTIKTPLNPELTFSDDPLRMMRAIRFAAQLNFTITQETLDAIFTCRSRISIISRERISDELNKILLTEKPSKGFTLLYKTKLLHEFFPQLVALHGVDEVEGHLHKDNFYHTLKVVDNISEKTQNLWSRWAALLHDIGKPVTKKFIEPVGWTFRGHEFVGSKMVPKIFKQLKMPLNEKMKYVQKIVRLSSRPIALIEEEVTDSAVRRLLFDAGDDIEELMFLCEADITTKNNKRKKQYLKNFEIVRNKLQEVEEKDKIRNWQPPIDGAMIMKTFKMEPGQTVGIIKMAIREAILEGQIENNFDAAYNFMLQKGKELGLETASNGKKIKPK